jgi:hypothetical protein
LRSARAGGELFQFDLNEYKTLIAYKSVELNNGALLTAQSGDFDKVFQQEPIDGRDGEMKFSTKGKVVNEKLKTAP